MQIRLALDNEFEQIWPFFKKIVAAGETYAFPTEIEYTQAEKIWMQIPDRTYVLEEQGKGVATLMCEHSKQQALDLGYKAMQFNFVVSTNIGAIRLWQKLGFEVVGTLPKAYNHKKLGYVDAFVMYQWLEKQQDKSPLQ